MTADCSRDAASDDRVDREPPCFGSRRRGTLGRARADTAGRSSMARKLKSDKCCSSPRCCWCCAEHRDGVQRLGRGGDGTLQPALSVPDQAGHVGGAGPGAARHRDARRLPDVSQPRSSGRRSASSALALLAVLFSGRSTARAAGSASAASACSRRSSPSSPRSSSPRRCSSGGCTASTNEVLAAADRAGRRRLVGADPARAGLRHGGLAAVGGRR